MNVCTPDCIYSGTVTEKHQNVPSKTNSIHADPSIDAPVFVAINENAAILFTPSSHVENLEVAIYIHKYIHSCSAVGKC
jgi:hypothetical protein